MLSYRPVQEESDELSYTVLVTRYGPRTSCQRKWLKPQLIRMMENNRKYKRDYFQSETHENVK